MDLAKFAGVEFAAIGTAGGLYLMKRGLWYQGKQKGRITRAVSVILGFFVFLVGSMIGLVAASPVK